MASPTPNGPTLADLEFQSYTATAPLGYNPQVYDQAITKENVVLDLVGYSTSIDTSDFINTSENVVITLGATGPNLFSIITSDTTVTSENVDVIRAGARNVTVSDSTVTSENVTIVEA